MNKEINELNHGSLEEAYRIGKSVGEKDAIRFMVKSFMSSVCEEHLIGVYEHFEREYYNGK